MLSTTRIVPPAHIQKALNEIWESLETTTITRACLFNLIFYTRNNHRLPYIRKLAQQVIKKFPARILFVTIDEEISTPSLKTEVAILTSNHGQFDVACDYIQIDASMAAQEQIPFVVLPHILPDLPVYLLLAEDPCQGTPLCHQLERLADRLILDSETTSNLPDFASDLLELHKRLKIDVADLNWARLESYRDLLSMAFHSEEKLQQIKRSKILTLSYNAQKTPFFCHTKIQALYLQSWLSSQLGWEFCEMKQVQEELFFFYKTPHTTVTIVLSPKGYAQLPPGLILSVDVETLDGESFSFRHNLEDLHQITFQHSTQSHCDLPAHYLFNKEEGGHSLIKEICHRGTSEHFLNTLRSIKHMHMAGLC